MMLIDNKFELEIPTHISFTLYSNDYIDGSNYISCKP